MKTQLFLLFLFVSVSFGAMAQAFGWTELGGDSNALKANGIIRSICTDAAGQVYAAGDFTNSSGKHYVAKWDGIRWSELGNYDNGLNENYSIPSICTDGFNIYAVSSLNDHVNYVAKYFSVSWESLPGLTTMGLNHYPLNINSICTDVLGNVYAGGRLIRDSIAGIYDTIIVWECIAKWDKGASIWSALPYYIYGEWLTSGGDVLTVCTGGLGNVYAAGFIFGGADTLGIYQVVNWNGTNFSEVGGIYHGINANEPINSLCTDALGHVYAGCDFFDASNNVYLAVWDGIEWSELGNLPFNHGSGISSVCTDDFGNVYTEGAFSRPSGSSYLVAKWDGMGWSELGDTINPINPNGEVLSLCADATGNVYAAGSFTDSSGYYYVAEFAKIDRVKWIRLNPNTKARLNSVDFPKTNTDYAESQGENTGYVAGEGGIILKTVDGGTNWTSLSSGTSNSLYSIYFPGANVGYAVGSGGTILKTSDNGTNWNAQVSGTTKQLNSVYFTDTATGYAAGVAGTILKTNTGGTDWAAVNAATASTFNSVYFTDANIGYVAGESGTILKTINGGTDWTALDPGTTNPLHSIRFINDTIGFAVGDSGTILKTTNGGTTWSTHNVPVSFFLTSVYFTDADTGYAAGANGSILKTTNGGTTWMVQNSGTSQNLTSIYFSALNAGYAVGDSGTIIGTTTVRTGVINSRSLRSNTLKIYPNPAFDKITIEISGMPSMGQLSIVNLNGVELLSRQITAPGTVVDINSLSSGIYILKFSNEKTVQVGKFIKN